MRKFLRQRRLRERIDGARRELARTDRERAPLAVARLCHRLAELYLEAGRRSEAVRWYGQSIDAYVYAGFVEAAAAMCNKLIELEPRVVRARATLAMLLLASGRTPDAEDEIRAYVDATRELGERLPVTHQRLLTLAELAEDTGVRAVIGQSLVELGAAEEGDAILRAVRQERAGLTVPRRLSEHERWSRLLAAALEAPERVGAARG